MKKSSSIHLLVCAVFSLAASLAYAQETPQPQSTAMPVQRAGTWRPQVTSVGEITIPQVDRKLRFFLSANNEDVPGAAGETYFYEPLAIFGDESGSIVSIEKTNDGKFNAVMKVLYSIPEPKTFLWEVNETYRGKSLKYAARYDVLAEAWPNQGVKLPDRKILRHSLYPPLFG